MSNVRFIGCLHLGHEGMAQHRCFESAEEYFQVLKKNWNKVVNRKDLVYILGDVTMEKEEFYPLLDELNGRKKVVLGNHDLPKDVPELLKYVETVSGMEQYKKFTLTHCPIHPQELASVKGNIHAHVHESDITFTTSRVNFYNRKGLVAAEQGNGYFNVDAEKVGYTPRTLEELGLGTDYKPTHFINEER